MITNVPFAGFYNSWYSQEVDRVEEMEVENMQEQYGLTDEQASALGDCFWSNVDSAKVDYAKVYEQVAKDYVDAFNENFYEWTEIDLHLTFESMTSPREYNFATDRIFAYISDEVVQTLFDGVDKVRLSEVIKSRFTSCSGFISRYSNYLPEWLANPVEEWDHNELCTLLLAWMPEDYDFDIFYKMADNQESFYKAWSDNVNWPAVEEFINNMKKEAA